MKYEKIPLKGYVTLNIYPVYIDAISNGQTPFKIVGLRETEVELEGDWGKYNITRKEWVPISKCHLIKKSCLEELGPQGCQIPNIHCCGGGSVIVEHVEYWK